MCNRRQKRKRTRFCNSNNCQKCATIVKNRSGHVFAIRKSAKSVRRSSTIEADTFFQFEKVPKVHHRRQKSSGHTFRVGFRVRGPGDFSYCWRCVLAARKENPPSKACGKNSAGDGAGHPAKEPHMSLQYLGKSKNSNVMTEILCLSLNWAWNIDCGWNWNGLHFVAFVSRDHPLTCR